VLVVDEAGMVPTRQLAALLDHVEAVDGRLVLVGDHRQLPALEAGGAFRGLVQRGLAVELQENRRQVHAWERGALEHLREGRRRRSRSTPGMTGCMWRATVTSSVAGSCGTGGAPAIRMMR
jgi:ATP-dependent exoDNAse (exonuclease V) alpha subunit